LSKLIEVITEDGSFSLRSLFFKENFHSIRGALEESNTKFINPSALARFKGSSVKVLDICFGLGYNSASLFNNLIKQNSSLNWYALEIDKTPLEYSIKNQSFRKLWNPKVCKIFESLLLSNNFEDEYFKCKIIWGEARDKIIEIPSNIKFDLIYLDGFSPQKCPQVWSVEFLSKVIQKINPQGFLITYSSSAAVRKTLRDLGMQIYSIKPTNHSERSWSNGTIAIKNIDEMQLKKNTWIRKLSHMEEEHLLTKAAIPYRDPNLDNKTIDIIQRRTKEQLLSKQTCTKIWREKWGMTK